MSELKLCKIEKPKIMHEVNMNICELYTVSYIIYHIFIPMYTCIYSLPPIHLLLN